MNQMKLKILLMGLLCLLLFQQISARDAGKRKSVYTELMGGAVMASVNYDFRFNSGQDGLGMRMGLGMVPDVLVVPVEVNGLLGRKRLAFEYGLGISTGIFMENKPGDQTISFGVEGVGFIGFAKTGIRIQPLNNGVVFNFNWNPIINRDEIRWTWFGLGIGYSWK